MMVPMMMPPYTRPKQLADGTVGYYWSCPALYKKQGCPYKSAALGQNLSQKELNIAAAIWNDRLDAWRAEKEKANTTDTSSYGSVQWLVNAYLRHDAFLERVSEFSRPDYRRVLDRVIAAKLTAEKSGLEFTVGDVRINQIGVSTAQRIYKLFYDDGAARTAEKVVIYCKAMWSRMRPHHPNLFRTDTPNPWEGVTLKRRVKQTKGHVGRDEVYKFAWGAVGLKRPELAAAAVLAFEWLMRPSNIGAGYAAWTGYRSSAHPDKIMIRHRKTGETALHPLEYVDEDGALVKLYPEAEKILAVTPRHGMAIVCQRNGSNFGDGTRLSQEVRDIADQLGMPAFTLDAARHGGMTELEESGLTEGEGRALSKHRTSAAYRGYAKETELRVLKATKKRFGHSEQAENSNENNVAKSRKK